jgi:hypothetical protein
VSCTAWHCWCWQRDERQWFRAPATQPPNWRNHAGLSRTPSPACLPAHPTARLPLCPPPAGVKQWVLPSPFVDLVNWVNQQCTPPVYNFIQARPCLPSLLPCPVLCCAALCSPMLCCAVPWCLHAAAIMHTASPTAVLCCVVGIAGGAWAGGGAGE